MSSRNAKRIVKCPFTESSVEGAFGEEVNLFMHCHLRGYDKNGDGKQLDSSYYDKYGAPVIRNDSWMEGYHVVEKVMAEHFNTVDNDYVDFPLIAGMAGGVHLYKPLHEDKPWNWTGWVPLQKKWLCEGTFFSNRYFLTLRGNEIQNNLWDYHPHDEEEGADTEDLEYSQLEPNDKYRGGYFFNDNPFGRYLHVISLKCHLTDPETGLCERYNYIVHPLAYRDSLDTIPDNTVDAMQWSVINIAKEKHFGPGSPWGGKVDAMEIFNDFTYYYSYLPNPDRGIHTNNGEVTSTDTVEGDRYIHWFNTYPLEYGEFLLDSALARGVYLQTLTANDAFYKRRDTALPDDADDDAIERHESSKKVLLSDPKGQIVLDRLNRVEKIDRYFFKSTIEEKLEAGVRTGNAESKRMLEFLRSRPYRCNTAFGYTTLIDTNLCIKKTVFSTKDVPGTGLDEGECKAMDYLVQGRFYSSTGISDLFNYEHKEQIIPYIIQNQPDPECLFYEVLPDMELVFTFARCKTKNAGLIWRYSMMMETSSQTLETVHGYFTLSDSRNTVLDLSKCGKQRLKWLYFTAIHPDNAMRRAWFSAVKGPAFGEPKCNLVTLPDVKHKVFSTKVTSDGRVLQDKELVPFSCDSQDLDFTLSKCTSSARTNICVYFMQVCAHRQNLKLEPVKESSTTLPPQYLESVYGLFQLHHEFPTRLDLSSSWDKGTVKDRKVYFYTIDVAKGGPMDIRPQPKPYSV